MKHILKDGSVVDEITQENHKDWVESILTKEEVLKRGKALLDIMAEKAYRIDDKLDNL